MKQVTLNDVRKAASPLEGRLETLHRKKAFDLKIEPYGFIYTPESTGTSERQDWKYVERVLERFNEIDSFSPSDYKDTTHAASYLLVIIRSMTK
jgi:hypothetical protein